MIVQVRAFNDINVRNQWKRNYNKTIITLKLILYQFVQRTKLDSANIMSQNNQVNTQPNPVIEKDTDGNKVNTTQQQRPQANQQKVTKIKLVTRTWTKDSYGLFDYQVGDQQYESTTEYIQESMFIVRDNRTCKTILVKSLNEIKQRQDREEHMRAFYACLGGKEPYTVLGQIVVDKQRKAPSFKLRPYKKGVEQQQPKPVKLETKHSHHSKRFIPFIFAEGTQPKSNGCLLSPGSIIKFGRVQYLVLQWFNGKQTKSYCNSIYYEDQEQNVFDVLRQRELNKDKKQVQDRENMNCKICLCNQQTVDDPLVSPCNCKGYCGLIHVNCLKMWINNKVKKENVGLATSYNFTKFECEICKGPFPKIIRTQNDHQVEMMSIIKPQKPYIMLQSLDPSGSYANPHPTQSSAQKQKLLHVISTDEKDIIKIGRGNDCEIRLTDISVSRKHAQIKLVDGNFYIKDTGAKFGTLVEMTGMGGNNNKSDIIINRKKPLKIQLGRSSYEFTVECINEDVDTQ